MGIWHCNGTWAGGAWKRVLRWTGRALACAGAAGIALAGLQFTRVPWKAYSFLSEDGGKGIEAGWEPTHIFVPGGSGVPGMSGLMRLWYAAAAAGKHPGVPVWIALPCGEGDAGDPAAAAYAAELRLRGVSGERCEPRGCGENTRAQAVALVKALEGKEVKVLLVTSPEHVRRACLAVRRAARDAGLEIDVRGLAAANLSLEDHSDGLAEGASSGEGSMSGKRDVPPIGAGVPEAFRYGFWNQAQYSVDSAREGVALAYYWCKGWI